MLAADVICGLIIEDLGLVAAEVVGLIVEEIGLAK